MTSDEPAEQVINLAFADADVKERMRENGVSNSAGLGTRAWIGQKAVLTEFGSQQVSFLDFFRVHQIYDTPVNLQDGLIVIGVRVGAPDVFCCWVPLQMRYYSRPRNPWQVE